MVFYTICMITLTHIGNPVDDNQNSLTAGEYGPILLQDFHLLDKLSHFDRERIPERVVHAKGAGAHGYFGKKSWPYGTTIIRSCCHYIQLRSRFFCGVVNELLSF